MVSVFASSDVEAASVAGVDDSALVSVVAGAAAGVEVETGSAGLAGVAVLDEA